MAKKLEKKAKVEPVQGSKVKKQKMALAKQLKSMSIGGGTSGAAKKDAIHRKNSSSSDDEEGANSDMEVDQVGGSSAPKVGSVSKPIKKYVQKAPKMSRATYLEMKKQAKRLAKSGQ